MKIQLGLFSSVTRLVNSQVLKSWKSGSFSWNKHYIRYASTESVNSSKDSFLPVRDTLKSLTSRKTILIDIYNHMVKNNEILLFVHHNNLVKADSAKFRSEIKKAGGQYTVIRNRLFRSFLRSENEEDPASKESHYKNLKVRHALEPLLKGPTAVITIKDCEPAVVNSVLKVLKTANDKLILIGARIENNVFDNVQVQEFKNLPNKNQLQGQLAGLLTTLGGLGLVQTLEASGKVLYLTLDQHRKELDPSEKKEETEN